MEHIDLIVEAIILGGIGFALWGQNRKLNEKVDKVLKNQEDQRVTLAETIKDVQSNKEWSKKSGEKIEDLEKRVNAIETQVAALEEFKSSQEKK